MVSDLNIAAADVGALFVQVTGGAVHRDHIVYDVLKTVAWPLAMEPRDSLT